MATALTVAAIVLAVACFARWLIGTPPYTMPHPDDEPTELDACYDIRPTVIYGPLRDSTEL